MELVLLYVAILCGIAKSSHFYIDLFHNNYI